MEAPDFWDNAEVSQKKMKELKSMKDDMETYQNLITQKEDMETLIEMSYEENDPSMIEEIQEARKRKIPIKFFNSDMEEIKYDALIINNRIGIGYKQIIEDTVNPGGSRHICPYAGQCEKSCAKASEKSEPVVSKPEDKLVTVNTKGSDWRSKLLAHFYRGH